MVVVVMVKYVTGQGGLNRSRSRSAAIELVWTVAAKSPPP